MTARLHMARPTHLGQQPTIDYFCVICCFFNLNLAESVSETRGSRWPWIAQLNFFFLLKEDHSQFLAHLSTCSGGALRVVLCLSCVVRHEHLLLNSQTTSTKFGRNVPWEVLIKICSQNLIPSKTLVVMAIKWIFLCNFTGMFLG